MLSPSAPSSPLSFLTQRLGEAWSFTRPFAEVRASLPAERFVTVGDQQVYVEQQGRGEPLLLLHGFACSSHSWRRVLPRLARRFRVIAPDLNGFGYTQRPADPASYSIEGQLALVEGVLEALGVGRFHLAGHSFGGGLAILLAARYPRRVQSLTLVCTVLPNHHQERRQPWARLRPLNYLLLRSFALSRATVTRALEACYCDPAQVTPEVVDAYRDRLLVEGLEDAYFGLIAPVEVPPPEIDLAAVRAPTLVIWGRQDRVIPLAEVRPFLAELPAARLEVFDRCGHAPMEEHPQRFLTHVLPFLLAHRQGLAGRCQEALAVWWQRQLAARWRRAPTTAAEV